MRTPVTPPTARPTRAWFTRHTRALTATVIAVVVGSLAPALFASPAAAASHNVSTSVTMSVVDDEGVFANEYCTFSGTTSQTLAEGSGAVQLGTGTPEISYNWNRGPFRDTAGRAISFFCGDEVSVCFFGTQFSEDVSQRSTVSMSASGELTVNLRVTSFEGDAGFPPLGPLPCYSGDWFATQLRTLTVPVNATRCLTVVQSDSGGDQVALSFCATNGPPLPDPPSPQPVPSAPALMVTQLTCEATEATRFGCDLAYTGGIGPYTIRWTVNGQQFSALNNLDHVSNRTCTAHSVVTVQVTVTDVGQRSASRSTSFHCELPF